jgi:hypothetical protein
LASFALADWLMKNEQNIEILILCFMIHFSNFLMNSFSEIDPTSLYILVLSFEKPIWVEYIFFPFPKAVQPVWLFSLFSTNNRIRKKNNANQSTRPIPCFHFPLFHFLFVLTGFTHGVSIVN